MDENVADTRGIKIALISFFALLVLQLVAFFLTNLLVLLAETFMELAEILISIFLLVSVYRSRKPADELHMFGHGRTQNVAALVSATIIVIFLSIEMFRESVPKLIWGGTSEFQNITIALTVILLAMIVGAVPLVNILRMKMRGAAVKAQLGGVVIEEVASGAALIGVILTSQGHIWADSLASTIIAAVIAVIGLNILKDNVDYLLGRAPSKEFIEKVESTAKSVKGVLGVKDLRAEYVGPNIISAGFRIEVAKGTPIEEADKISHEVDEKVSREADCQYCVIHVHPANSTKRRRNDICKFGRISTHQERKRRRVQKMV